MYDLVPSLTFVDPDTSMTFLTVGLGFSVVIAQHDDGGQLVHTELRCGDVVIMGGPGPARPTPTPGLYLVVDDVDALYTSAIAAGAAAVFAPEDTEWGTRRARITDPDGHEWSFGTYLPGRTWTTGER
jgi:uncharacterized glyoxalase superfamily protein PhnB